MKKIFGLLIAILLLTSCDDGEMTFQTFNFTAGLQKCELVTSTKTYISVNTTSKEVLIINFPSTALPNVASTIDADGNPVPTRIPLSNGAIEYRVYSGSLNFNSVCSAVDNGGVNVSERWLGSGTVAVVTVKIDNTDGTTSYQHSVTLEDVSFTKGDQTIRILDNYLGTITSNLGFNFDFNENHDQFLNACVTGNNGRIFLIDGSEAILFTLASTSIVNEVGPKDITIDDTNNYARFRVYDGTGINREVICNGALSPVMKQEWRTSVGVGRFTIVTAQSTTDPTKYYHDIYLYGTRFYNVATSTESYTPTPNDTDSSGVERFYVGRYAP
nr:hypothetical protein [uncultured Flavobacterium sp.]